MKIWPKGFLGMLISKIAGTTTSLQPFPPKIEKFKMAAIKHDFVHKTALSAPISMILMSIPMFLRSRNLINHMSRLIEFSFIGLLNIVVMIRHDLYSAP